MCMVAWPVSLECHGDVNAIVLTYVDRISGA